MTNQPEPYQDEINLRDYIDVLIKRKVTVIVAFLICVITAAVYSFTAPEVYKLEETIRIGRVGGALVSKAEAIKELQSKNILAPVAERINTDVTVGSLKKAVEVKNIKGTDFIVLSMEYTNVDKACKILEQIAAGFIKKGNQEYKKEINSLNERIAQLEKRKQAIQEQINSLRKSTLQNRASSDYPLIQNTLTNYERIYSNLTNRIYSMRKQSLNAKKFEIFEAPIKPEDSIRPKKRQNIAIAGVVGLMLGVFLAFFKEFWEKTRINTDRSR